MTERPETLPYRILGVDPGLNISGYAVVEATAAGMKIVEAGVVRSKSKGSLTLRIQEIYAGVSDVVQSLSPDIMAIEELYSHYKRPKTAILMGHARGVICLAAAEAGIPVKHYAATEVKKMLTGSGQAPKSQIQLAVCREFRLAQPPEPPDVADAIAIATCHYFQTQRGLRQTTL